MSIIIDNEYKEVDFATYCKKCVNKGKEEKEDPCCYCLEEPVRVGTSRPVRYKAK